MSRRAAPVLAALLIAACTTTTGSTTTGAVSSNPPASAAAPAVTLTPYLETLARMAPGDPERQQAELAATLASAQQERSFQHSLRYALALGSAGHASSNPAEAKRIITELLAGPNTLDPAEVTLASAYLREFESRATLYADIARQREEYEQQLQSLDATAARRAEALAVENKQLKRALAEAERKLEAVADMERSLLEQAGQTEPEEPPRP